MYGRPVGELNAGRIGCPSRRQDREVVCRRLVDNREQTAEQTNRDLEVLHVHVAIEREVFDDELARLVASSSNFMRMSVSSVSTGVMSSDCPYPIVRSFAQRLERVVSPRVTLVIAPGMEKLSTCTDWRLRVRVPHRALVYIRRLRN